MTKLKITILPLVLMSMIFTSCNGQIKREQTNLAVVKELSYTSKKPKLTKTQGTNEHQSIRCSLQDKDGNLWFGTTGEGVYRYDGTDFTQFTTKDGLSNNSVWSILEDRSGRIWIGTTEGVCRYDKKSIIHIPIKVNFVPTYSKDDYYTDWSTKNTIWSMFQDKSGNIWLGTGDGVYAFNGTYFTRFLDNQNTFNAEGLHLKMIDCILEDRNGIIWFASGMPPGGEGIIRFDGTSITSYKPNGDGWIRTMLEDKSGNLWFGGRGQGNFIYDGKDFIIYTEKTGIGNPILADSKGNIWFSGEEKSSTVESENGIWSYDGQSFINFNTKDGLGKYSVWNMLEDINGNIWIGTRNCKLYRYDGQTFTDFSE